MFSADHKFIPSKSNTILGEVSQRKTIHDIAYMWNLKSSTNEFIYKTEIESQM